MSDDLSNWIANSHEVRAVGITSSGRLLAIKEIDDVRGMSLTGLIVSIEHRPWYKENEAVLHEAFSLNPGGDGQIIVFGSTEARMEVF